MSRMTFWREAGGGRVGALILHDLMEGGNGGAVGGKAVKTLQNDLLMEGVAGRGGWKKRGQACW